MSAYDIVLLDLDGTLCEYVRGIEDLLAATFETVGVEPLFTAAEYRERLNSYADRADSMAHRRRLIFADLAEASGHDPDLGRTVADAYSEARDPRNVRFLDGAAEALATLAERYPLGLVTNGGPDLQDPKLDALGVGEYFETVVYGGHDTPAKPDSEPFERALAAFDAAPERAVYVGNDYEADIVGAANAGLSAVMVGEPPSERSVDPMAAVETPGDVPEVL